MTPNCGVTRNDLPSVSGRNRMLPARSASIGRSTHMTLSSTVGAFGYASLRSDKLDDWAEYGPKFLGLQPVERLPAAVAALRGVSGGIAFADPAGTRLEAFHGAETSQEPFVPGRPISG